MAKSSSVSSCVGDLNLKCKQHLSFSFIGDLSPPPPPPTLYSPFLLFFVGNLSSFSGSPCQLIVVSAFEAFTDGAVPFVSTARENGTGLYFCGFFVCSIYLQLVAPSCHLFERWGNGERKKHRRIDTPDEQIDCIDGLSSYRSSVCP